MRKMTAHEMEFTGHPCDVVKVRQTHRASIQRTRDDTGEIEEVPHVVSMVYAQALEEFGDNLREVTPGVYEVDEKHPIRQAGERVKRDSKGLIIKNKGA